MPQWVIVALRLTGLGWYIALCIVLGVLGGLWLGQLTGQTALLVLLGATLGSVAAFYGVWRMVLPAIYGPGRRSDGMAGGNGTIGDNRGGISGSGRNDERRSASSPAEKPDHGGNGYQ